MKSCILFLHGRYKKGELFFYEKLCRGKVKVAVDGGYSFFRKTGLVPQVLIGDFDSLKRVPRNLGPKTKVLTFPSSKDETDSQLAVEYCLEEGAKDIDIVVPNAGEPDHFLGNFALLSLCGRNAPEVNARLVNIRYQVVLLDNNRMEFAGCRGHLVSVIPMEKRIELTCRGTEYDAAGARIAVGDSRAMRNMIAAGQAWLAVKGRAFVIHQFNR